MNEAGRERRREGGERREEGGGRRRKGEKEGNKEEGREERKEERRKGEGKLFGVEEHGVLYQTQVFPLLTGIISASPPMSKFILERAVCAP